MLGGRKTVICEFLGTGMISVMPVPLLSVHTREYSQQGHIRYVPSVCVYRWTVRCLHINRLYKLSESIWRKFCEVGVSMCPLNKLFKVFYLSFLYFNLFLQIYDFNFELRLLILVGLAHHGKAIIV